MEFTSNNKKEPIRILHVVGSIGLGGIQSYLINLYRNIDRNIVQFDFIVHLKAKVSYEKEILDLGGKIYYLPSDCFKKKKWLTYLRFWKRFLKEHPEYKIIHGHLRSVAFIYMTLGRLYERKVIAHAHAIDNGVGKSRLIKDLLQYPIRHIAQYYFGCSKNATIWMFGKKRSNSEKCFVLRNGIEVEKYKFNDKVRNSIRHSLGIPENAFVIGSIGRLVIQKNQTFLIKIHKEILQLNNNSWLILVGDGPLFKDLQNEAENVKNILFLGARTDVPDLLQGFDVFAMPSIKEGLGISAIEAQAAGLPTIVSDILPEEAFITPLISKALIKESPKQWADKIIKMKNIERQNTLSLIIDGGYDVKSIANWLLGFYLDIISQNI